MALGWDKLEKNRKRSSTASHKTEFAALVVTYNTSILIYPQPLLVENKYNKIKRGKVRINYYSVHEMKN